MNEAFSGKMKNLAFGVSLAFVGLVGGCAILGSMADDPPGGSCAAWTAISNGAPIRVAVFTGNGAKSTGMFRWLQLMELSSDFEMTPVDGETIRAGALRMADVLVMPGGKATEEAVNMQTNGLEEVRAFIRRGGSYVGTCAGCFLLLQYARDVCLCPLLPYMFWRDEGDPKAQKGPYLPSGIRPIVFNARAKELIGIEGVRQIGYYGGPVMMPTGDSIEDGAYEVLARYAPNAKQKTAKGVRFEDCIAAVGGRYGKGRIIAFAVHPEMTPETSDIVQGAFRYLTGRDIRLPEPAQDGRRLKVGLYVDASFGHETAAWVTRLLHEPALSVEPLSTSSISKGKLKPLDVLVVPDVPYLESAPCEYWRKKGVKAVTDFLAAGGRVITWGEVGKLPAFKTAHERLSVVADAEAALALAASFGSAATDPGDNYAEAKAARKGMLVRLTGGVN